MNIPANLVVYEVNKVFEDFHQYNEIDSELILTDCHFSYICHYDSILKKVLVNHDRVNTRSSQVTPPSAIMINDEIKYYFCINTDKHDNPYIPIILDLLSNLISTRLETHLRMQEIHLKNEHMKQITETVSAGSLSVDPFGAIMFINDVGAEMLGLTAEEVVGKPISDVLDHNAFSLNVLQTGKPVTQQEIKIKINKGQYYFQISSVPLYDNLNEPVGIIFHFKDIRKDVEMIVNTKSFFHFDDIIYHCEEMENLITLAKKAALQESNILIEGESGTGKELIAQSIHNHSNRSKKPFVVIDCSAIPRNLVESELFGYEEGAFTGSSKGGRMGKFERANGGTVFLDEIGELPLEIQSKLLRVLQSRSIIRVGGHEPIPINIRIIAATNRNLAQEVVEGSFRNDLYYRLNVINLFVPSLRERKGDLPLLVKKFMEKTASRERREVPNISEQLIDVLENYSWPGNIRELENTIERAVILANEEIGHQHLPKRLLETQKLNSCTPPTFSESFIIDAHKPMGVLEQHLIMNALKESKGNKSKAAKILGIARSTLYEKMYLYNLQ